MIPFGNHPLYLLLLGWMLPPKPAFMKFTTTPVIRAMTFTKQVFQDIVLPINKSVPVKCLSQCISNNFCIVYQARGTSGRQREAV